MTAQKTPEDIAGDILWERAENFKDCYFSAPAAWTDEDTRWVVISFKEAFAQALRDAREAAIDECAEHLSQCADKTTNGDLRRWFDICAAEISALKKGKV